MAKFQVAQGGEIDFLGLGALGMRLNPGQVPLDHAETFARHHTGAEYNPTGGLASLGLRTAFCSAMVNSTVGRFVQRGVRADGVRPYYKMYETDCVRGPNMAIVFSDDGFGPRAPEVEYYRANEAGALLKPGDFDWEEIFGRGVRWVHSGGIFASLSETTPKLIIEMMQAAGKKGAVRSYDLNFRSKLWRASGGLDRAVTVNRSIVHNVDVLVGNEEDLQAGLGIKGPAVESVRSKLDPSVFFGMIDELYKDFPNIKMVATTLREVHSASRHSWAAVLWYRGEKFVSPTMELDVLDRIGGGDGFAAGLFYGLLNNEEPEAALRLGWAHGALLATYHGDVSMARIEQVRALAQGGSARVQR